VNYAVVVKALGERENQVQEEMPKKQIEIWKIKQVISVMNVMKRFYLDSSNILQLPAA